MTIPNNANTYLPPVIVTPGSLLITAITNSYPMVVTITNNSSNVYIAGMLVYFTIPSSYGMFQLNAMTGQILSISGTNFTIDIDSTLFDVFAIPLAGEQPASLSAAGSRNLVFGNDAINHVPFENLNNIGN